jgi:hypothetical protein
MPITYEQLTVSIKTLLGSPGVGFELTDAQVRTLIDTAVLVFAPY